MEQWRDINGYEGLYQVSNLGNIKSLQRVQCYIDADKRIRKRITREKQLVPAPNGKHYLGVTLYKNGRGRTKTIHRLVAETFIPNPLGLTQVNHKDENKTNNTVGNLEWCTCKYNINYGSGNLRRSNTMKVIKGGIYEQECTD